MRYICYGCLLIVLGLLLGCSFSKPKNKTTQNSNQFLVVLGTIQDAGYPHIGYPEEFEEAKKASYSKKMVSCLGLVDKQENKTWMFDATPDFPEQLNHLITNYGVTKNMLDGVFLTHAHIGHYTGLMYLGREAINAKNVKVYAMPRMKTFLENNGPWSQLVQLKNISLQTLQDNKAVKLSESLSVTPIKVPHRDEFSETVGYKIEGKNKSALFIPDIDKWHLWDKDLLTELRGVDYAFIDATFFKDGEVSRPMSQIPHPFIQETVELFKNQPKSVKQKVIFIHFNHSNPAIQKNNPSRIALEKQGFNFAETGDVYSL